MADNYIEKQFEQYEARKSAWQKSSQTTHRKKQVSKPRVLITGGAHGIGKCLVEYFCKAGWQVAFCDINSSAGSYTATATGATFIAADVSKEEDINRCMRLLFEAWGDIDVIINNAGISEFGAITTIDVEDFDRVLNTNLRPIFITSRLLALHRKNLSTPNSFVRIINISSTRYLMSEPGSEGYAASKGGINSLTHALAISLAEWHITVNCIAPGWIETGDYSALRNEDHEQHPSRRVGTPQDIARVCLFICQKENDFINGECITVDGGMTKKDRKSVV